MALVQDLVKHPFPWTPETHPGEVLAAVEAEGICSVVFGLVPLVPYSLPACPAHAILPLTEQQSSAGRIL